MYPEKLNNATEYRYNDNNIFSSVSNSVKCFTESDYSKDMHTQDFFEINIVLNGSGMHYIENNKVEAKIGDVFIIPPNVPHGYFGNEGFDVCHILLGRRFMEKYIADLQLLPSFYILFNAEPILRSTSDIPFYLTLSGKEYQKTLRLTQELNKYSIDNTAEAYISVNSLTLMLIAHLCKQYSIQKNIIVAQKEDVGLLNALALIHSRYSDKLSIEMLASVAMLSRNAFIRKFNEICKMPPAKYINNVRIQAAQHMLDNTTFSIEEIAERTGFYDSSHFTKAFTSKCGVTPNRYRKKNTNNMY